MLRPLACLLLFVLPALAEAPNLSVTPAGAPGSPTRLVLAQRAYAEALRRGDAVALLVAIRLARSVTTRPATGWTRTTTGDPQGDAVHGRPAAPDPAGEAALTIARNLAGEDPDLQDLVYDLDAQRPDMHRDTAVAVAADLFPGQTDTWQLPLFGEVGAELALIGDGDGALSFVVTDESGATVCAHPAGTEPVLCRLTPARNGFFAARVTNSGDRVNSYRLVGN